MTSSRTALASPLLAGLLAASACVPDLTVLSAATSDAGTTASGGHGGATAAGGHGGSTAAGGHGGATAAGGYGGQGGASCVPACKDPVEPDCESITCNSGTCKSTYPPNGTKVPDAKQTAGNCKAKECDGAGKVVDANDDLDVPNDSNDCTTDTCTDGVPKNDPVAVGTACANSTQVCDATGTCVACNVDADCKDAANPSCDKNKCVPAGCIDKKKNGDETDVDCGGSCNGCDTDKACINDGDCLNLICTGNKCAAATCNDGVKNGTESDLDCGGSCPGCGPSLKCGLDADCAGKQCDAGTHTCTANCGDGVVNNAETDIDCGGDTCDKCADGLGCKSAADCSTNGCCNAPAGTCSTCCDGVKDGTESDLDCGGSCALKCADNASCNGNGDCLSAVCQNFTCKPSTCSNGALDVGETDIDCGGPCQPCTQGKLCLVKADCASSFCTDGVCCNAACAGTCQACSSALTGGANGTCGAITLGTDPANECSLGAGAEMCGVGGKCQCSDVVKNASETDIDCGGPTCGKCADGKACGAGSDCLGGTCAAAKCTSSPVEVCNFVDDNGDGQVDEGFDWTIGPWTALFSGTYSSSYPHAIRLSDGRVAVAAADSMGGGNDYGLVFVLSTTGTLLLGPTKTKIPNSGMEFPAVAEGSNGDIAALYGSTNYSGCNSGCPVLLVRHKSSDLSVVGTTTIAFPFNARSCEDLASTPTGYAAFCLDTANHSHVTFLDATGAVLLDKSLPGVASRAGALGRGPGGLAWTNDLTGPPEFVQFGVLGADGNGEVLGATTFSDPKVVSYVPWNDRGDVAWLGNDVVIPWVAASVACRVSRWSSAGALVAGPVDLDAKAGGIKEIETVGDNVVVTGSGLDFTTLTRLRGDLQPVATPTGRIVTPVNGNDHTLVRTDAGLLLVRGTGYSRVFYSATVTCP